MSTPAKGTLLVETGPNQAEVFDIQFNPSELLFEKQPQFAEIGIPGLDAPLQQFVRGGAEKLTLELFCDSTDQGMGAKAWLWAQRPSLACVLQLQAFSAL